MVNGNQDNNANDRYDNNNIDNLVQAPGKTAAVYCACAIVCRCCFPYIPPEGQTAIETKVVYILLQVDLCNNYKLLNPDTNIITKVIKFPIRFTKILYIRRVKIFEKLSSNFHHFPKWPRQSLKSSPFPSTAPWHHTAWTRTVLGMSTLTETTHSSTCCCRNRFYGD